jgi:hypothetical protein
MGVRVGGMTHEQAIHIASGRRRVTRFERRGDKVVRIIYSLVHSNNENDRAKAHAGLRIAGDE